MRGLGLFAAGLVLCGHASAGSTGIGFEDLQPGEQVLEYFNGGAASVTPGPGPSLGVSFDSNWTVYELFRNEVPKGNGVSITGIALMNMHGLDWDLISFYCMGGPLTMRVYDHEDGQGTLLGTIIVEFAHAPDGWYEPEGLKTDSPIRSAVFEAPEGQIISPISNTGFVLPEPGGAWLSFIGIAAFCLLALVRGRQLAADRRLN